MTAHAHLTFGARGEEVAARHLESAGLRILDRNWRCPLGELDIVATDEQRLVFCEVKTRASDSYGAPAEAVDRAKADRIRALASRWRLDHGIVPCETRFDIVSVLWPPGGEPRVRHLVGAF